MCTEDMLCMYKPNYDKQTTNANYIYDYLHDQMILQRQFKFEN